LRNDGAFYEEDQETACTGWVKPGSSKAGMQSLESCRPAG